MALAGIPEARADELRAHGTLGAAHALGAPQSREFGLGVTGAASLELPLSRALGVEGKLGGLLLSQGDPPENPGFARAGTGTAFLFTAGLRVRPFTVVAGPWASLGLGGIQTGSRLRPGFDAALGYDFRVSRSSRWDVGPYVGYDHVFQSDDALRPEDARVLSVGLHVGLGVAAPKEHAAARADRDLDGVFDDEDACPDTPGRRTDDPKTNGCPRSDRDGDTVFDDEDACPEIAGVRTEDPKTNGCPPASANVRIEKDRILLDEVILFDTDSPRVRHASWGIVEKLAKFIVATPDVLEVSIEGHADARGREEWNLRLSRMRAESVKRLLVKYGVNEERLVPEAFGRSRLRVNVEGDVKANRRVEFWVTRTRSTSPSSTPSPKSPAPKK